VHIDGRCEWHCLVSCCLPHLRPRLLVLELRSHGLRLRLQRIGQVNNQRRHLNPHRLPYHILLVCGETWQQWQQVLDGGRHAEHASDGREAAQEDESLQRQVRQTVLLLLLQVAEAVVDEEGHRVARAGRWGGEEDALAGEG